MPALVNLSLFAAEALLYFAVMTALFRVRHRFGIGLFFCALGTMHFLETYLAAVLYVSMPGGFAISPGSVVLFSGKLVMLLLVYIREDASTVRQPIYGILIGNFLTVGLVLLLRHHILLPEVGGSLPNFAFMDQMGWLMVWGTTLLYIDCILIILLYERSAAWFGDRPLLRIVASTMLVLTFDQVGFYAVLRLVLGLPFSVLAGGWIAKMTAAILYSVLAAAYLRWVEAARPAYRRKLGDVFDALTYRQRYEALLRESGRDSLTGLLDRGRFDRDGVRLVAEALTRRRPISLLVVDVDHFKTINDSYGHAMGDEALRRIAAEFQEAVREDDQIYRYGGEEFAVLCHGLPHQAAILAGERLRLGTAALQIPGVAEPITVSVGVASAPDDGRDLAELFAVADKRLYEAKNSGRDRVVGRRTVPRGAGVVGLHQEATVAGGKG